MSAVRVLIVDDEPVARNAMRQLLKHHADVLVVGEARNGPEAVRALEQGGIDLVFLDVQMPELDGFGVIASVGLEDLPAIVFVTAFDRHALRAFEVHAIDYLLKPFTDERFREALDRAKALVRDGRMRSITSQLAALLSDMPAVLSAPGQHVQRLAVRSGGRVTLLAVRDIDWIEAQRDYVRLHCGKAAYVIRETMKNLVGQLDPKRFVRIHRASIVNIERVKELHPMFKGEYIVVLHDGTELKLSRGCREHFEAMLGNRL